MRYNIVAGYRLVAGLLVLGTFVGLLASQWSKPSFSLVNLLSYFTVQSNLIAAGVLLAGVVRVRRPSPLFEWVRGAAVLYLVTTGIVFAVLLSGFEGVESVTPWFVNLVMHQIMPVFIVVDWLVDPPRMALTIGQGLLWLVYPLVYLVYTLLRGPFAGWYPYPFVDPAGAGGYGRVGLTCVVIAAGLVLIVAAITWAGAFSYRKQRKSSSRSSSHRSTK